MKKKRERERERKREREEENEREGVKKLPFSDVNREWMRGMRRRGVERKR